jgi:hypothetical protein
MNFECALAVRYQFGNDIRNDLPDTGFVTAFENWNALSTILKTGI